MGNRRPRPRRGQLVLATAPECPTSGGRWTRTAPSTVRLFPHRASSARCGARAGTGQDECGSPTWAYRPGAILVPGIAPRARELSDTARRRTNGQGCRCPCRESQPARRHDGLSARTALVLRSASGNVTIALAAAAELPHVPLDDALALLLRDDERRFDRAVVRWHALLLGGPRDRGSEVQLALAEEAVGARRRGGGGPTRAARSHRRARPRTGSRSDRRPPAGARRLCNSRGVLAAASPRLRSIATWRCDAVFRVRVGLGVGTPEGVGAWCCPEARHTGALWDLSVMAKRHRPN